MGPEVQLWKRKWKLLHDEGLRVAILNLGNGFMAILILILNNQLYGYSLCELGASQNNPYVVLNEHTHT